MCVIRELMRGAVEFLTPSICGTAVNCQTQKNTFCAERSTRKFHLLKAVSIRKCIDKSNNTQNSKFGKQWTPSRGRSASADGKKHWPIVTKNTSTADCRMCAAVVRTDVTDHLEIVRKFLIEPASFYYL
jgi:hypothetical protein